MSEKVIFGQILVNPKQVFFRSALSYCLVNLKPVLPGHVLVVPNRRTSRFADLTAEEVSDLWSTVQKIAPVIEKHFSATSITFAIQDGPEAGQTIDHVHVHVMPRFKGDFNRNDQIYEEIESDNRVARTAQEMEKEATILSKLFQ